MKNSIRPLAIIVVSIFGFLLIVSFYADKSQFELSGKEMHDKVMSTNYELDSVSFSDLQNPILIDIRDEESYLIDHMPGAINIPLSALLDDDNLDIINKDQPKVILGSTDPIRFIRFTRRILGYLITIYCDRGSQISLNCQ